MIISILICDDDNEDLCRLKNYIDRFFFELPEFYDYRIDTCTTGDELLSLTKVHLYHAIFLDIELPGINGIDVAKKIRESNDSLFIIFVTSYERFMRDSFEVQPFQYIEKPVTFEFTRKICHSLINAISKKLFSIITISTIDGDLLLNTHELMYLQSVKNKKLVLEFHLSTGEKYITTGKIAFWEKELKTYGFLSSIRGTLVNINHVRIIADNQIILKNDEILPLSRRQSKLFSDTFVNHVISILH